jgi:hypothetical protein
VQQSQKFGHALKTLNIPSTTVIYPDEGRTYAGSSTLADFMKMTLA